MENIMTIEKRYNQFASGYYRMAFNKDNAFPSISTTDNKIMVLKKVLEFLEYCDEHKTDTGEPIAEGHKDDDHPLSFVDACQNSGLYKTDDFEDSLLEVREGMVHWVDRERLLITEMVDVKDVLNRKYRRIGD